MISILPAKPVDLSVLRKMAIDTYLDTFGESNTKENMEKFIREAYSPEQFEKELSEPDASYYIAWEGKEAAGFMRLRVNREVEDRLGKNTLELQRLYVTKEFLGRKVGAQLMQFALDYARTQKFDWLWLGVWERNSRAIAFYTQWGFERFSEHIFLLGHDPQTDWLMKLKL